MIIEVRPLEIDDSQISYNWRNNPKVWELTGSFPDRLVTLEMEKKWIEDVLKREDECRFAILCDRVYVGNIYITGIDLNKQDGELHYFLGDPNIWNKGITTKAVSLVIDIIRDTLDLKKLYAIVKHNNVGSLKMLQKNGFMQSSSDEQIVKMELLL